VLVKVLAAPINHSDLSFMKGNYENNGIYEVQHPNVPGWEGSGIVVAAGGGMTTWGKVGKRCSFLRKVQDGNKFILGGGYQQYVITNALSLVEQKNADVSDEVASMQFVNPLTSICLLHRAKNELKSAAVVQTGAASQLGRMLIYLAKEEKVPLINIVRREE